jgi:hypothetical protein
MQSCWKRGRRSRFNIAAKVEGSSREIGRSPRSGPHSIRVIAGQPTHNGVTWVPCEATENRGKYAALAAVFRSLHSKWPNAAGLALSLPYAVA